MPLSADQIIETVLAHAPGAGGYWVAYSGGLDSHVLLHALASRRDALPAALGAVHVNHNLQSAAAGWAAHCRQVCVVLDLPLQSLSIRAAAGPGESPEAAARQARYRALVDWLPAGQVVLTAHHQDDQAETLLLQLLRGAGPKGLAAMPVRAALGKGQLLRPLLGFGRSELHAYAEAQVLEWIEDPSNAEPGFDRNFLRHEVMPRLRARWPATAAVLARSAAHQAEAAQLLDALADMDLRDQGRQPPATDGGVIPAQAGIQTALPPAAVPDPDLQRDDRTRCVDTPQEGEPAVTLAVARLLVLDAPRRANLLRHWLHRRGAPTPSSTVLARIEADLLRAAPDATPQVQWGGVCLRRYRDGLYLTAPDAGPQRALCVEWDGQQPLPFAGGLVRAEAARGQGVALRQLQGRALRVRLRQGGERLRPVGRREHHLLKHLFQEAGVPPWERGRVPLLYLDDTLIAVAGYWVCAGFQAAEGEPGVRFLWSRAIVPHGSFW